MERFEDTNTHEKEPTTDDLIVACRDVLDPAILESIADLCFADALGAIYGELLERMIDPDIFLKERGFFE